MSVSGPMLPLAGNGSMLCAWLLGIDLLLAVLMIGFILLCPEFVRDADASVM